MDGIDAAAEEFECVPSNQVGRSSGSQLRKLRLKSRKYALVVTWLNLDEEVERGL
jgi:hypothetical protein